MQVNYSYYLASFCSSIRVELTTPGSWPTPSRENNQWNMLYCNVDIIYANHHAYYGNSLNCRWQFCQNRRHLMSLLMYEFSHRGWYSSVMPSWHYFYCNWTMSSDFIKMIYLLPESNCNNVTKNTFLVDIYWSRIALNKIPKGMSMYLMPYRRNSNTTTLEFVLNKSIGSFVVQHCDNCF